MLLKPSLTSEKKRKRMLGFKVGFNFFYYCCYVLGNSLLYFFPVVSKENVLKTKVENSLFIYFSISSDYLLG